MFERYFNSFNTRFDDRGSRTAANESACAFSAANSDSRRENSIILLSLDTVLAVSILLHCVLSSYALSAWYPLS